MSLNNILFLSVLFKSILVGFTLLFDRQLLLVSNVLPWSKFYLYFCVVCSVCFVATQRNTITNCISRVLLVLVAISSLAS